MLTCPRSQQGAARRGALLGVVALVGIIIAALLVTREEEGAVGSQLPRGLDATAPAGLPSLPPMLEPAEAAQLAATAVAAEPGASSLSSSEAPRQLDLLIVDSSGSPVPEADIRLYPATEPTAGEIESFFNRRAPLDAIRPTDWDSPGWSYVSDGSGRCRVEIGSAQVEVLALKEGVGTSGVWQPGRLELMGDVADPDARRLEVVYESAPTLVLRPQATISGIVLDNLGRPVAGATIEVVGSLESIGRGNTTRARRPSPVLTDEKGRFSVSVDAPTFLELKATSGEHATETESFSVDPAQAGEIELRLPGAFVVKGRVVGDQADPVSGASVAVSGGRGTKIPKVKTGADGTFHFELARAGEYSFAVTRDGLAQESGVSVQISEETPERDIEVRMTKGGSIAGQVRWSTGEPIERSMVRAEVELRASTDEQRALSRALSTWDMTDAQGRFRIDGIHPTLSYSVACWHSLNAMPEVEHVVAGREDVELVVDREAAKGVSVRLTVVDMDSAAPIPNFRVTHDLWVNGVRSDDPPATITDASGRFVLNGCRPDSDYGFLVEAEGYARRQVGPIVPGPDGADVAVALGRAGNLRTFVLDEAGQPVPGASVLVCEALSDTVDRFDDFQVRVADQAGIAFHADRPPGRYVVMAATGRLRSDLHRAEVGSRQVTTLRVTLSEKVAAGELLVTARHTDGTPFADAEVNISCQTEGEEDDASSPTPKTDATGQYRVTLQPGLYWVWVDTPEEVFLSPMQAQVSSGTLAQLDVLEDKD